MRNQPARRVAIVGGLRIPFCRSHTAYRHCSNQDMLTAVLRALVEKYALAGQTLGDASLGAVLKHSRDWNLARESVLSSGLAPQTPAFDLQRACGTSLSAAVLIGAKISTGLIDSGLAGGTDTVSDLAIVYPDAYRNILLESARGRSIVEKIKPWLALRPRHFKPEFPGVVEPRTKLSMGESMEITAKEWQLTREDQDQLALESHQKAARAYDEGYYDDLVIDFQGVSRDNNIRADTSLEQLARLKPVFDRSETGTMTAGNSTPLTDGASATLLASEEWAQARGLPVLAYLTYAKVAAVDFVHGEGLLMAPAYAVSNMLADAELSLQDFDFYEIHEAFAAQTLATLKAWESDAFCRERLGRSASLGTVDRQKLNVKGGSVAIGHPFAATGTRILASLAKL
ncbi:MAG: acetyl-CoA C-acetyltransferase, partial [Gammaproteobacteria bacterium]